MRWLVLALGVWAAPAAHGNDAQATRLENGKVEITTRAIAGSALPEVTAAGLIAAPPERVWAIIEDCANFYRTRDDPARTLAVYRVHAVPKTALPDALLQQKQRTALPALFTHLRQITNSK